MHLSRELALEELRQTIDILKKWIEEIETPSEISPDGKIKPVYPRGVPPMISVVEIKSIHVPQLRSELAIAAAKLEAIAST